MTEHYIKGRSITHRPTVAGDAGLPSARWEIALGSQASPSGSGSTAILWPNPAEWDDIGFGGSVPYDDGGFLFEDGMDGDYLITAYAQLDAGSPTSFSAGQMQITINSGIETIEHQSTPLNADARPKLSVTSVHRFYSGAGLLIDLRANGVSESSVIWYASVTITKLKSIPPL